MIPNGPLLRVNGYHMATSLIDSEGGSCLITGRVLEPSSILPGIQLPALVCRAKRHGKVQFAERSLGLDHVPPESAGACRPRPRCLRAVAGS